MMEEFAHPFPLIRGGGLFLISVGLGFLIGWMIPRYWVPLAVGGFVTGGILSSFGSLLAPPLGVPTVTQIAALIGAIIFEIVLIIYVNKRFSDDERKLILSILIVVGLHFLIMGISYGPLMAVLGILTVGNAWIGLRYLPQLSLRTFGIVDSLLKIAFGIWMVALFPSWGWSL